MGFVIDNNQISEIRRTTAMTPSQKQRIILVLPPLVEAQSILWPVRRRRGHSAITRSAAIN